MFRFIPFALLIFIGLFAQPLHAQEDTSIAFVAYWGMGDSYDFQVTKIKKTTKDGELIKDDSSSYIITFEVLDSTENSYTIQWAPKRGIFSNIEIPKEISDKLSSTPMPPYIYKTDELGAFLGLQNYPEIKAYYDKAIGNVQSHFSDELGRKKGKKFKKIFKELMSIYSSKEGVEGIAMKQIQYFHMFFGAEYDIRDTIFYEDLLPNLIGGDPLPANGWVSFDVVDFEDEYCLITDGRTLDEEASKALVLGYLKKIIPKKGEELPEMEISISDFNISEFAYNPGVPLFIEANRTTIIRVGDEGKRTSKETHRLEIIFED